MSTMLERMLELKKLQQQEQTPPPPVADPIVETDVQILEESTDIVVDQVFRDEVEIDEPPPPPIIYAPCEAELQAAQQLDVADAEECPAMIDQVKPKGKIGRPRRPGKTVLFCLAFNSEEGEVRFSQETWPVGAYGLRKALGVLEWSRKETGSDDWLVVYDPAFGKVSLQGLDVWPMASRKNRDIPETLEEWAEWGRIHGLTHCSVERF